MRKLKEILRLRFGLGLQQNQIARSCSIGQATVHRYLRKAGAAGLTWPLPEDLDDRRLEELLFPAAAGRPSQLTRALPDFDEVRRQLQTHKQIGKHTSELQSHHDLHSFPTRRSSDLPKLFHRSSDRSPLPAKSRCRRPDLAVAGRLG